MFYKKFVQWGGSERGAAFHSMRAGVTRHDGQSAVLSAMLHTHTPSPSPPPPLPPRADTHMAYCQQAEDKNLVSCLDLFLLECFAEAPLFLHAFANLYVSPIWRTPPPSLCLCVMSH